MLRARPPPPPPPLLTETGLMTAGKQEKRKAYWEGKDGGRETIPFSLNKSTGFWLVWQNGKHPMTDCMERGR